MDKLFYFLEALSFANLGPVGNSLFVAVPKVFQVGALNRDGDRLWLECRNALAARMSDAPI